MLCMRQSLCCQLDLEVLLELVLCIGRPLFFKGFRFCVTVNIENKTKMSWSSHCDYIRNLKGVPAVALSGPQGGQWGESHKGDSQKVPSTDDFCSQRSAPTSSITVNGEKLMFLREVDNKLYGYKKGDKSCAVYDAGQYTLAAFSDEADVKLEKCVECVEKGKEYLTSIGYN